MKVILTQSVPKVGKEGNVVNVADGYARNYLFPRSLAIIADKTQIAALNRRHERTAAKSVEAKAAAEKLGEKLAGSVVKIEAKVGAERGKLFGAVTNADVTAAIEKQLGVALQKKQVTLIDPIRRLGQYEVVLDLHRDVDSTIIVDVFDPNAPVEKKIEPETEPEASIA